MTEPITVRYTSSRALIGKWYRYSLKTNRKHRLAWLLNVAATGFAAFVVARSGFQLAVGPASGAAVLAAAAMAGFFATYPQLRFKPQERTLTISGDGIDTVIGRHKGHVPWSQVAEVEEWHDIILVRRRNLNSFLVPSTAFDSPASQRAFVEYCRREMEQARTPTA